MGSHITEDAAKESARRQRADSDIEATGKTMEAALMAFAAKVIKKEWLSMGLDVEIMTICGDDPPYATDHVLVWAWAKRY